MSYYTKPVRITSQIVERNMQARRDVDIQRRELKAFADGTSKLLHAAGAQERVEIRRHQTHMQSCRQEQQYEERIEEEQYRRRMKELNSTQNAALASALDKEACELQRRQKELQRLC